MKQVFFDCCLVVGVGFPRLKRCGSIEASGEKNESVADGRLVLVSKTKNGDFQITSPAKFIDLHPPSAFAKPPRPLQIVASDEVAKWSFNKITRRQLDETYERVIGDAAKRREYLETAFTRVITDLQSETAEAQGGILLGDTSVQEKIQKNQMRIDELVAKKARRLRELEQMIEISPKLPEVLGCAYIVPLNKIEYQGHYGMSCDDEAEQIAMRTALDFETENGWTPQDVSANKEFLKKHYGDFAYDRVSGSQTTAYTYTKNPGRIIFRLTPTA